jgi:hypothetical protein
VDVKELAMPIETLFALLFWILVNAYLTASQVPLDEKSSRVDGFDGATQLTSMLDGQSVFTTEHSMISNDHISCAFEGMKQALDMPVYYINMDSATSRRKLFEEKYGCLNLTRISGSLWPIYRFFIFNFISQFYCYLQE